MKLRASLKRKTVHVFRQKVKATKFIYFIYLLVSPYYNIQNYVYNKNKNNIHDYRQGDRNSVSQLLRARKFVNSIKYSKQTCRIFPDFP
jgi:hypothetical protein